MRQITKWEARDGSEFSDKSDCFDYERLCSDVSEISALLPPHPKDDGCSFSNGGGYIQLSEAVVSEYRNRLLDIIATKVNHRWVNESRNITTHPSYVERLLGDGPSTPLYSAWARLSRIDKQWREWGQPYYSNNPDEGKQIELAKI